MGNLQSSPSSSTTTLQEKYDVFLSFRGEDTRDGFTNNLYEVLSGKKIKTFMDNQLTRGDIISQALTEAIEESKISVIIFSKDYASSKWCLRELIDIMERKKKNKQTVIPVFYGVDPSDVRNQTGSFKDSFNKHESSFPDEVQKWREALKEASLLSGHNSFVTRPDTKLVNVIVDDIYKKLTGDENISSTSDFEGRIGLDERINQVKSLLCLHKTDVRIIGIWGMGGIGKTTLAEAIFKQILGHQFGGVCLILNVKENIKKNGPQCLQKDILSKVLNELVDPISIPPIIKKRLNKTRVFIVLDDVDDFSPLETLASRVGGLGQGSRIIITSRDKQVLRNCGVNDPNIYGVEEFNRHEAFQLFYSYAFKQNHPTEDLKKLSNVIVHYAKGNPLALKVLGSSLYQKHEKVWESAVKQLRTNVDSKILDVLKISYDGLNAGEQEVFLDIACFLRWESRDYVAAILDDCDYSLSVLIDKTLITVSDYGDIDMHDLLQDLGREIVRKESPTDAGKRSRLWAPEDVQCTLKHGDGTNAVQGIFLNMFKIKDIHLSLEAFNKMYNLRLLKFCNYYEWDTQSFNKVQFREGLNNAPFDKLRSFIWVGYPLPALSSNFNLENLVELDLSYSSNLERLWEDIEPAPKLKWLRLDDCPRLVEIPDLSGSPLLGTIGVKNCGSLLDYPLLAPRVSCLRDWIPQGLQSLRSFPSTIVLHYERHESLHLSVCTNLTTFPQISGDIKRLHLMGTAIDEVPPSIENLIKLSHLNLLECTRLKHISTNICKLKSLKELNLWNCSQLESFPEILDKMEGLEILILSGTAIEELPHSIENLIKLSYLNLLECTRLKQISTNICKLKSLKGLNLENCSQLESFPEILEKMGGLEILILSGTAIKELPHSIEHLTNLSELYLSRCKNLDKLPCTLISLKYLDISDCSKLEKLPENFGNLKSLEDLSMDRIAISQLPSTMMHLNKIVEISCRGCRYLRFTDLLGLPRSLRRLDFSDCNLNKIPEDIGCLSSLWHLALSGNSFESLPKSMKQLYKLTSLEVDNCNMLQSLTDLPSALEHLSANGCNMLQSLTELPSALEHLSASGCKQLQSITDLPSALKYLSVSGCNKILSLTELPSALKYLSASGCKQLQSIPDASEFANLVEAEFIFTNCLNLKETAVSNMLATLKELYEEGDKIGKLTFFCPGSRVPEWFMYRTFFCPGSKVPEWFMYRTEGSSIVDYCELKFQMPQHDGFNGPPLLGFVVCAVIAFEKYCCDVECSNKYLFVDYNYTCSDGDKILFVNDSRKSNSWIEFFFENETLIDSDHIAFQFFKISVPRISESDFINCSFELWLQGEKNSNCRIKSFGVCPIYAKHNITLPSFKKQKTIMSWTP